MEDTANQKHKIELVVTVKQKSKSKPRSPKKGPKFSKRERILRNFLLLLAVSINTATGVESAVEAKNIIKKIKGDLPDQDSSKKFSETAKDVIKMIKENSGKDVLSLSLLIYQIYNTIKGSYTLVVGKDKISTKEFKMININGIVQNALVRGINYAVNGSKKL